jgi:hypothetical protein
MMAWTGYDLDVLSLSFEGRGDGDPLLGPLSVHSRTGFFARNTGFFSKPFCFGLKFRV